MQKVAKVDLTETIVDHSDREGGTYKIGYEVRQRSTQTTQTLMWSAKPKSR